MKIEIVLSENELKKLSELTEVEIDIEEPDNEDVSYAIGVLINNL
jgi:hypothetical protein